MQGFHSKPQAEWITRFEIVIYVSLLCLGVVLKVFTNALTWGGLCSGTGTGGNQAILRVCGQQDAAFFYPFILDLMILLVIFFVFRKTKLQREYRGIIAWLYFTYILISSLFVWNIPFFVTPIGN